MTRQAGDSFSRQSVTRFMTQQYHILSLKSLPSKPLFRPRPSGLNNFSSRISISQCVWFRDDAQPDLPTNWRPQGEAGRLPLLLLIKQDRTCLVQHPDCFSHQKPAIIIPRKSQTNPLPNVGIGSARFRSRKLVLVPCYTFNPRPFLFSVMWAMMRSAALSGLGSTAKLAPKTSFSPDVASFVTLSLPATGGITPRTV